MSDEPKLRLSVQELLRFFDERVPESRGHASAVVAVCGEELGIGLMRHYFEARGAVVETERLCTQRTPTGARLDGWLRVRSDKGDVLYQVEIKNWSAHAIFGKELPIRSEPDTLAAYKKACWERQWGDEIGIKQKALIKVLTKMRPPAHWPVAPIETMACFWTALHPIGGAECFFSQRLTCYPECAFERLWVFSMSSYLRSLDTEYVELHMPDTVARLAWLRKLIAES